MKALKKLYHWMLAKAKGPYAVPALAAVSFAESSFFPLPPDLMLIPMCLADRKRAFWFAFVCTVGSIAGALVGYGIGYFFYESVGKAVLNLYGGSDVWYAKAKKLFDEYGAWIILIKGLTPFPFKVLTILSGMMKFDLMVFVVCSIITRSGRFFLVAGLLYIFGEQVRGFLEKHLEKALLAVLLLIVAGFVMIKFLF
jgi:membrane protein YqaA with SNARE-associated domain